MQKIIAEKMRLDDTPKMRSADIPNEMLEKKRSPDEGKIAAAVLDFNPDSTAILLDVDGTLLDIAPMPMDVRVPRQLHDSLQALSTQLGGAIAFVSGRPIAELDHIFKPLQLPAVGGHGAEVRYSSDGGIRRSEVASLDEDIRKDFSRIGQLDPGIKIEDKNYSLAIHYRLAPQFGGEIMKRVADICKHDRCDSLEVLPGKAVIEIKPKGYNKGTGLHELMAVAPFTGRRPIFVGDDVTDNAAFAALPDFHGIGCSVGGIVPGATFNFDGPQDVRLWLYQLSKTGRPEAR